MTSRSRTLAAIAAFLVLLVALSTSSALLVARELNSRTAERVRADQESVEERAETRRIVDDMLCELAALRRAAENRNPDFAAEVPYTVPRKDYRTAPCPPPREVS